LFPLASGARRFAPKRSQPGTAAARNVSSDRAVAAIRRATSVRRETPSEYGSAKGVPLREILVQCADLPLREIAPGEVLIEQGEMRGRLYVLEDGAMTIERDGVAFAFVDTAGSVLGELSIVLSRPATATVRASTGCRLRVAEDAHAFLTERPGVALAVLRTVAARLDGLTGYLADVKRQFADHASHFGMIDEVLNALIHHQPPDVTPGSARDPDPEY
jgi:CRP-like cAMP-binding protein